MAALRGHISLLVTPPMAMGDVSDVGRRMGMFLTIAALSALPGTPISGLINARTGGFKDPGIYTGAIVMFSVLLFFVVRYLHLGRLYGKCLYPMGIASKTSHETVPGTHPAGSVNWPSNATFTSNTRKFIELSSSVTQNMQGSSCKRGYERYILSRDGEVVGLTRGILDSETTWG